MTFGSHPQRAKLRLAQAAARASSARAASLIAPPRAELATTTTTTTTTSIAAWRDAAPPRVRWVAWAAASGMGLAVAHGGAFAQAGRVVGAADVTLEQVVVTATRTPTRIDDALGEVTVIDRTQLDRATGRTLSEVLGSQPGVQWSSNGGLGKSSSVFLRGLEARHTLLLVDGVRLGSATVGTPSFDNLPLEQIERIEIVRGPLSGLYGSDAVGGVIQVFTRRGRDGLHAQAMLSAGSNRTGQASAGLSLGQGPLSLAAQVQHTETRGVSATNPAVPFGSYNADRDGFRQDAGSAQLGLKLGAGWRADAQWLQSRGKTQIDEGPGADSRALLSNELAAASVGGPVSGPWRTQLRASRSTDGYDTQVTLFGPGSLGLIRTVQRQFSWENTVTTPLGTALILAERLEQAVSKPGSAYTVSQRNINALALGLNGQQGAHGWQANLRRDRNSQYGGQTTGTLAYAYTLNPAWRLGGSYGTSFVAPSFNQLYFPGFGNPLLQPEEGRHGELNVRWLGDKQQVRAAWFDNRIRGFITPGPNPSNVDARIDGLSLSYEARREAWTYAASLDHVDPRNDSTNANAGKWLPRRAKDSLKASADVDLGRWQLGASLTAFGPRFDNAANTIRLGGFTTVDVRADWRMAPQWTLGLRLNNLGDKTYQTVNGYNQPGREGFVTVRYSH